MKPGDKVMTVDGPGILQGKESRIKTFRYGVILEGETEVKYYWPHEINMNESKGKDSYEKENIH